MSDEHTLVQLNHKKLLEQQDAISTLQRSIEELCYQKGFSSERYAQSLRITKKIGPVLVELKLHYTGANALTIDHSLTRKTLKGQSVKSERTTVTFASFESELALRLDNPKNFYHTRDWT